MDTATELLERLQNKMKLLSSQQDWAKYCCIYTVPHSLRNMKPLAYTPQLISIGPLHHGDERLKAMEEQKLRYLEVFIEQNEMDEMRIMDLLSSIHKDEDIHMDEEYIRLCYPHRLEQIESIDLVEMIVLDSVFIIEFFKKLTAEFFNDSTADRPRMFFEPRMTFCILEDLMLLENQLPFFVIEKIFKNFNLDRQDIEYIDGNGITFLDLAAFHFRKLTFTQGAEYEQQILVMNFTDLLRNFMLKGALKRSNYTESIKLKYSAIMLRKAGIKFKVSRDNCLINIQFENGRENRPDPIKLKYNAAMLRKAGVKFQKTEDKCLFNVHFEKGVLKIPILKVDDSLECLVRNVMAWEQRSKPGEAYISNYFKFMDHLIDKAEDVALLGEEGIIINWLGDDAALMNNLSQRSETASYYSDICQDLNEYSENPWNSRKATLKLVYFSNLWRGTGTVAAAFLLILTLLQTITSLKSSF
ncbi:UPF0481 protein [Salix suchowensis]|nr:UPF0481 protein [Salix suchowensis]